MINQSKHIEQVPNPPKEKPLMVFDGNCGFCKRWVKRWQHYSQGNIDFMPYQEAVHEYPEIPETQYKKAVQFITTDGSVYAGAEAVFRSLAYPKKNSIWIWMYLYFPLFGWVCNIFYDYVARNRYLFSKLMIIFMGKSDEPSSYVLSRFVFLRGVGLVFLFAFISFYMQWEGLIGSDGIAPGADLMNAVNEQLGSSGFWSFPTLLLWNSSDGMVKGICSTGIVASIFVIVGFSPALFLFISWFCYLSLIHGDHTFFSFQWDTLLLETGLLSIFYAPVRFNPTIKKDSQPPLLVRWMLYWLLFRLMFGAGFVKLTSGDAAWHNLTAMNYHYFTQPIPAWTSWYAHHLPGWFQSTSVVMIFIIELVLPFLIFTRGWLRLSAFIGLVGLQLLIASAGNYGFFNLLTGVLCLTLLDDKQWRKIIPYRFFQMPMGGFPTPSVVRFRKWIVVPFCLVYVFISGIVFSQQVFGYSLPERIVPLMQTTQAFRSINRYGLFAVMTTTRPEIIIEGSRDGNEWKPYTFHWKPVKLDQAPQFIGAHMPRLDWQMWFAALGSYERNRWIVQFMAKLLENEEDVIALLKKNPFEDEPPKYIRAVLYQYEFTTPEERAESGNWWKREQQGLYCPVLALKSE